MDWGCSWRRGEVRHQRPRSQQDLERREPAEPAGRGETDQLAAKYAALLCSLLCSLLCFFLFFFLSFLFLFFAFFFSFFAFFFSFFSFWQGWVGCVVGKQGRWERSLAPSNTRLMAAQSLFLFRTSPARRLLVRASEGWWHHTVLASCLEVVGAQTRREQQPTPCSHPLVCLYPSAAAEAGRGLLFSVCHCPAGKERHQGPGPGCFSSCTLCADSVLACAAMLRKQVTGTAWWEPFGPSERPAPFQEGWFRCTSVSRSLGSPGPQSRD